MATLGGNCFVLRETMPQSISIVYLSHHKLAGFRPQTVFRWLSRLSPDPGLMTLSLPSDISAGAYAYDIQITETNGDVKTWVKGKLVIEKDETNVT
jgi:hypothetical protein